MNNLALRTCISCRKKYDKKYLNRFAMVEEDIVFDKTGRIQGRGVYLCNDCLPLFDKNDSKTIHKMAFQLTKKIHNGKKSS